MVLLVNLVAEVLMVLPVLTAPQALLVNKVPKVTLVIQVSMV
jgi:hypothetical protein